MVSLVALRSNESEMGSESDFWEERFQCPFARNIPESKALVNHPKTPRLKESMETDKSTLTSAMNSVWDNSSCFCRKCNSVPHRKLIESLFLEVFYHRLQELQVGSFQRSVLYSSLQMYFTFFTTSVMLSNFTRHIH